MAGEWLELSLAVSPDDVEPAADVLRRYAAGVSIEEKVFPRDEDGGYEVDRCAPVVLRIYLPRDGSLSGVRRCLRADLRALALRRPLPRLRGRVVREEDWAEAWKRHVDAVHVGRRLVVCPTWREYAPAPGELVVRLDPGVVFGSGHHPTTRMCLEALERRLRPGDRVLDLGTGTGVLAVAAALLGAGRVEALDIDPRAAAIAADNLRLNGVADRAEARAGSLGAAWPFSEPPSGRYDLALANVSAAVILDLAGDLVGCLRPGGTGIAGGIVEGSEVGCGQALEGAGAVIAEVLRSGDWRALVFRRG